MTDVIPDVIGEVKAYRAWWLDDRPRRPIRLLSLGPRTVWPTDDWLRATCQDKPICARPIHRAVNETRGGVPKAELEEQPVPGEGCTCGIYAARDRAHLAAEWSYNRLDGDVVIGTVALAGRIIPGTKAYRAERARPTHLLLPYARWKAVDRLADAYHVPVGLSNLLADMDRLGR